MEEMADATALQEPPYTIIAFQREEETFRSTAWKTAGNKCHGSSDLVCALVRAPVVPASDETSGGDAKSTMEVRNADSEENRKGPGAARDEEKECIRAFTVEATGTLPDDDARASRRPCCFSRDTQGLNASGWVRLAPPRSFAESMRKGPVRLDGTSC
jgi:hypothetical protein